MAPPVVLALSDSRPPTPNAATTKAWALWIATIQVLSMTATSVALIKMPGEPRRPPSRNATDGKAGAGPALRQSWSLMKVRRMRATGARPPRPPPSRHRAAYMCCVAEEEDSAGYRERQRRRQRLEQSASAGEDAAAGEAVRACEGVLYPSIAAPLSVCKPPALRCSLTSPLISSRTRCPCANGSSRSRSRTRSSVAL
jgi:hypothetical protein